MNFTIFVLLGIIVSVRSDDLRCYQCDPRSAGNCESPDKTHTTAVTCTETNQTTSTTAMTMTNIIMEMAKNATERPFCYYLYLNAGISEDSGHYRGCSKNSEGVFEFCKLLNNRLEQRSLNETMRGCQICNNTECNVGNLGPGQTRALIGDAQESPKNKTVQSTKSGTLEKVSSLSAFVNLLVGFFIVNF